MTVLAPSGPQPDARAGWQCPGCLTYYSPDMEACQCAATRQGSFAERAGQPQVIVLPGGAPRSITQPQCTCPQSWNAVVPPPPCPVHGQTAMFRATC